MKKYFLLYCVLFMFACSSQDNQCIEEKKEDFIERNQKRSLTHIYIFQQDNITYHIFDEGIAFDAIATVFDENCTAVCAYGGFRLNNDMPCDDYQSGINRAQQIWP